MLKEGVFDKYQPQAVFGLHMWAALHTGQIGLRAGPFMAASDSWRIEVQGKQAHGSRPWQSVDPIVTSAQIINSLQTIVSQQAGGPHAESCGRQRRRHQCGSTE